MPSPFPGMDPYLEAHWRDVHARLIIYASDALQDVLPRSLRARVEESVLLELPTGYGDHPLYPDVRIVEFNPNLEMEMPSTGGVALAEPILVATDSVTETFIEIIDRESGNRVVTVIEFLSPSNKSPGPNREKYQRKQIEIRSSDTNLVEIDLNRFGTHTLAFPIDQIGPRAVTAYMACVRRASDRGTAEVYRLPLSERLPAIKIPLRPTDADVPLDLQALVEKCYRNGGYEGTLDYSVDPEPPLRGAIRDWADEMLRAKGLRPKKASPRRKSKSKKR